MHVSYYTLLYAYIYSKWGDFNDWWLASSGTTPRFACYVEENVNQIFKYAHLNHSLRRAVRWRCIGCCIGRRYIKTGSPHYYIIHRPTFIYYTIPPCQAVRAASEAPLGSVARSTSYSRGLALCASPPPPIIVLSSLNSFANYQIALIILLVNKSFIFFFLIIK